MMKVTPCTTWWFRDTKELEFSLFRYVGSIIHKDGEFEEDVIHKIRAGLQVEKLVMSISWS